MKAREFALLVKGVRQNANGFVARCPAHGDQHPSLSFTDGEKGLVVKCHRGCSAKKIAAACGITVADLFQVIEKEKPPFSEKRVIARYPYEDERGTHLFQVERYEPKSFSQRKPDGRGGWNYSLGNVRRVIYRLPRLLERMRELRAGERVVYVVEGEKDVDRMWDLGVPATCNPMGAGNWRDVYSERLRATGVEGIVIVPDNDTAGETHARAVARSCFKAGFKVRVVRLPGLPPIKENHGEDISDWLDLGHSREELMEAVDTSPPLTEEDVASSGTDEKDDDGVEAQLRELAALTPLEYETRRKDEAERLDFRVSFLDAEVEKRRESDLEEAGSDISMRRGREVEPADEPVDGAELLRDLADTYVQYIVLLHGASTALSLWAVFTYLFDLWAISPYIYLTAPEKESGKTNCLTLLMYLSQRSKLVSNTTAAPVYRAAGELGLTVGYDEVDTYVKSNPELIGIMNAGHTREGAWVERWNNERGELEEFGIFHPKAFAGIGRLRDTLESRSVIIPLRRKRKEETVKKLSSLEGSAPFLPLARRCARWALDNREAVMAARPEYPKGLSDRAEDNWHPLLAIADVAGGEWPEKAREAAVLLSGNKDIDNESIGIQLLADIRTLFRDRGTDALFSEHIVDALVAMEGKPWAEFGRNEKPLSKNRLATLLGEYRINSGTVRIGKETKKGYKREWFEDTWARYLPDPPRTKRHNVTFQYWHGF